MNFFIIPVTKFKQNCIIVWENYTGIAALIDPGGEICKLKLKIKELGVDVKQILLTHGHIDHVGGAHELSVYYNIPIIGPHIEDKQLLDNLPEQCKIFGMKYIAPLTPDHWLSDHDKICIGNLSFNVLHCPGHSPGHIVFWNEISKYIFMGDVLFKNGIGRTDLPGSNSLVLLNTIRYKLLTLHDDISFIPGHGSMSTIGYERKNNIYLKSLV